MTLAKVVLAAELPDPGAPTTVPLVGVFGAFVGGVIAVARGRRDRVPVAMAEGSLVGYGVGLLAWLAALAMDRL